VNPEETMQQLVRLKNETKQVKIILLDHPVFHRKVWGFEQKAIRLFDEHPDGTVTPKLVRRVHPGALRVLGGEKTTALPSDVLKIPKVAADVRAGKWSVEKFTKEAWQQECDCRRTEAEQKAAREQALKDAARREAEEAEKAAEEAEKAAKEAAEKAARAAREASEAVEAAARTGGSVGAASAMDLPDDGGPDDDEGETLEEGQE
jgi:hypothetical protein